MVAGHTLATLCHVLPHIMYVLIYDVHSICTIVGQRYKKLRCDLHLIPLHSALKHSQWLPKCKQLCTQKLFYQSKMIFLVHLGSPKPTQLIGSQLQCTLCKYDADLFLTLIMHYFDSNFDSGRSFEKWNCNLLFNGNEQNLNQSCLKWGM